MLYNHSSMVVAIEHLLLIGKEASIGDSLSLI